MDIDAFAFGILIPNSNQLRYLENSKKICENEGFIAVHNEDDVLYFIFDTEFNAQNARIKALNEDLMICGGKIIKVSFDEKCLSGEYQNAVKKKAIDDLAGVVELEHSKYKS